MIVTVSRLAYDKESKEPGWAPDYDQPVPCVSHAVLLHLIGHGVKDAVISGDLTVESPVVEVSSRLKCARWRFEEKK